MLFPLVATSALVPSFLLVWYFRARDANPEPARVLWATFGLGVATVIPVLCVAIPVMLAIRTEPDPILRGGLQALFAAALPEELFKYLVVRFYCMRHREFDEPMDGIVYGAVASLGFATLENVLYVASGGLGTAIARALTAVPAHAFMGGLMGYYIGQARFGDQTARAKNLTLAYFVPMAVHALYDAPLLALQESGRHASLELKLSTLLSIVVLIVAWRVTVARVNRLRRDQLHAHALAAASPITTPQPYGAEAPQYIPPVGAQPPAPQPGASPRPPPKAMSGGTVALITVGAILASVGGLITLGVGVDLITGGEHPQLAETLIGAAVIGIVPLVAGILMFRAGLRRMTPA
jgi:RsiW-degrading membrane proteinase PrsW (M82 family)